MELEEIPIIDTLPYSKKLHDDLLAIFQADDAVEIVEISDEFPL